MTHGQSRHQPPLLGVTLRPLLLAIAVTGVAVFSDVSAAPDKDQMVSRVIGKEMTAAQKALQSAKWQEALDELDAAEQKSPLTPFDLKTIYDFRGYINIKLNRLPQAQAAYEKALATGQYTAADDAKTKHVLFQLAASNQQLTAATMYGEQAAQSTDDMLTMAQLYYQRKDCKDSSLWADKAIESARRSDLRPKEVLYQIKLQCASDAADNAAMRSALVELIKLTNKSIYWNTLLRIERQDERNDHDLLMIYRVMYDTNSMNAGADFLEMAQLLRVAALPGEAQRVLERGLVQAMPANDPKIKDRATHLLDQLRVRAASDKRGTSEFETEASKNPAGEPDVKLGQVYFGFGDYQNAIRAITAGLRKGQVRHPDEAYVYLGRAQLASDNPAEARKSFAALTNIAGTSPRVSRLWALYAEQLPSQGAAPAPATITANALPAGTAATVPATVTADIVHSAATVSQVPPPKEVSHSSDDDSWIPVHRIALVIGNSSYGLRNPNPSTAAWPDLEGGPLADAKAMDALLRSLNFDVKTLSDANLDRMNEALGEFSSRVASQPDALALFYFSGHGTHAPLGPGEDGEDTYLVPVSSDLTREQEAHYKAVSLSQVTAVLRAARAGIVILDACRNNGLLRASTRGAATRGLARINAVSGMLFAYSTAAGDVADNRPGQMSRYTELLVTQFGQPGESVEKSFRIVRKRLSGEGGNMHLPELTVQLNDDIYLR